MTETQEPTTIMTSPTIRTKNNSSSKNNNMNNKRQRRLTPRQISIRQKEREAAQRTLNGNGMNGSLPPLPTSSGGDNSDDDDYDDDEDDDNKGSGFDTLFGHPYGALPYGNIHLALPPPLASIDNSNNSNNNNTSNNQNKSSWHPDIVRHQGLGPHLHRLNDEQLLSVLSYVDGPTLANGVVAASRFLYVAGHHEELWRDLTLRRWGEVGFDVLPPDNGVDDDAGNTADNEERSGGENAGNNDNDGRESDDVQITRDKNENNNHDTTGNTQARSTTTNHRPASGCWKDIYAINHYKCNQQTNATTTTTTTTTPPTSPPKRHTPIPINGIYSDTFFRSWLCRSFALQPSWLSTHTVATLPHSSLTPEIFIQQYEQTNTPLLIKGASLTWPALRKWNQKDYLLNITKNTQFRATSGAAPLPAQFTMENYFHYAMSATEEAPLYLFDRTFAKKCPELLRDFDDALKESLPFWNREFEGGQDLLSVLGEEGRPDYQWLIVGPKRSGSSFHIDPNATHAWNAPIIGKKRWIFYPPGCTPPGVYPSPSGDDVCMPISLGEWFLTFWDAHVERRKEKDITKRPLECTAYPGDVLFVPHGWWHLVLNLGEDDEVIGVDGNGGIEGKEGKNIMDRGVSVALTRNYVSASNLPDVLRFFDTRLSQISGCRDRDEAVKPEDLGREFRKALLAVPKTDGNNNNIGVGSGNDCGGGADDGEEKKETEDSAAATATTSGTQKGKWADLLEKSEKAAKEGWHCAAWKDLPEDDALSCGSAAGCERTNEKRKGGGTSILARAKQSTTTTDAAAVTSSTGASSGGGFSFSFL